MHGEVSMHVEEGVVLPKRSSDVRRYVADPLAQARHGGVGIGTLDQASGMGQDLFCRRPRTVGSRTEAQEVDHHPRWLRGKGRCPGPAQSL